MAPRGLRLGSLFKCVCCLL
uniref:Uncharacterized protein n=1 Tax=Arundo donax TaxID=35708 RepID=A0A0A8Z9V8_ARUDO